MSESNHISFESFLICKGCNRPFSLAQSIRNTINGVRFPNRDASLIEARCPRCHSDRVYNGNDLWRVDKESESEEVNNLRGELAQTKVERDTIKKLYEELLVKFADIVHSSQQPQKPTDSQMQPVT